MENPETEMIVRYLKGECGNEEKRELEKWLEKEPNRQALERLKKIWEASGKLYDNYQPDHKIAWNKIENNIAPAAPAGVPVWTWIGRAAAVLVVAVSAVWLLLNWSVQERQVAGLREIATGPAIDSVRLSDGTMIWLNRETTIRFPETFPDNERRVYLSGEAFFQVEKEADRPFVIEGQNTVTRVLGTSFNLRTSGHSASVEVVTGKVSFAALNKPDNVQLLTKGEKAAYDRKSGTIEKMNIDNPNFLAWKTGVLEFEGASLPEVAAAFSKYYDTSILIDFPNPDSLSLTASFERQSLEEAMQVIALTLDIQFEKTPTGYLLKK